MDYTMPRAHDVPSFKEGFCPVPATTNPLGVKGAGEAGTTAAIAAVMNAVADAIPGEASKKMQMPATSEKLWRARPGGGTKSSSRRKRGPYPRESVHAFADDRRRNPRLLSRSTTTGRRAPQPCRCAAARHGAATALPVFMLNAPAQH
jgi:hypothetical protein